MPDLSDGANWSETDANNNNPSPNGWPEGMMPSGVNDAARADRGAMKRFWNKINAVQTVTASAGVYTFTTANTAYPTAYVSGEIYRFRPGGSSVGGEQFQVNALGPKPIWRRIAPGSTGLVPIVAQDIIGARSAEVVYDSTINAGAGAFVLSNPFIPVTGDGAGGISMTGSLSADGYKSHSGVGGAYQANRFNLQWTGTTAHLWIDAADQGQIVLSSAGNTAIVGGLTASGLITADGFTSHAGQGGAYQANTFNIQWTGTGAHLWIDNVDQGRIVTSTAGNVSIGGGLTASGAVSAASVSATGNVSAATMSTGSLTATGAVTAASMSATGNVSAGSMSTTGSLSAATMSTTGAATVGGDFRTNGNGSSAGGVSIYATAGAIRTDVGGTALYAPNGNVVCQGVTAASNIVITGHVYPSTSNLYYCGLAANYWYQVTAGSGGHQTISDPSLKRDIESAPPGCLDLVRAIEPKTYRWKGEADRTNWGFLAPEVAAVMERACHKFDGVTTQDGVSFLAYNDLIAVLWAAVRELAAKLEDK